MWTNIKRYHTGEGIIIQRKLRWEQNLEAERIIKFFNCTFIAEKYRIFPEDSVP